MLPPHNLSGNSLTGDDVNHGGGALSLAPHQEDLEPSTCGVSEHEQEAKLNQQQILSILVHPLSKLAWLVQIKLTL